MKITGENFLTQVADTDFPDIQLTIEGKQTVNLDELFETFDHALAQSNNELARVALNIDGGVAEGGTTLSLESNVINLPLRYQNELKKLIVADTEPELNVYMIAESPLISKSAMKIELAASLSAYLDDSGVKQKINRWFDEQLAYVSDPARLEELAEAVKKQAEAEEKAEAESESKKKK